MCLDRLDDYEVKQDYGWKMFYLEEGDELFSTNYGDKPYKTNKWHHEKEYRDKAHKKRKYLLTECPPEEKYRYGFHIYLKKKDAKELQWFPSEAIQKVRFRNVVAKGWEAEAKVIVAKEMLIVPERRK